MLPALETENTNLEQYCFSLSWMFQLMYHSPLHNSQNCVCLIRNKINLLSFQKTRLCKKNVVYIGHLNISFLNIGIWSAIKIPISGVCVCVCSEHVPRCLSSFLCLSSCGKQLPFFVWSCLVWCRQSYMCSSVHTSTRLHMYTLLSIAWCSRTHAGPHVQTLICAQNVFVLSVGGHLCSVSHTQFSQICVLIIFSFITSNFTSLSCIM